MEGLAHAQHAVHHHSPAARRAVLGAAALLYISGTIGSNIAPAWIVHHPTWVLALSSRNRNLFASVPFIDVGWYWVIGFVRLAIVGAVLYFVGSWFGHQAITWTEKQVGEMPALYRWFERGMDRASWAFVLLMPGSNLVCMMAGHRRIPLRRFLSLLAVGIVLKLAVLWKGGKLFEHQIRRGLDAIDKYQWWIVGGLFAISFAHSAWKMRNNSPVALVDAEPDDAEPDGQGSDDDPDPAGDAALA
jgi:membrane protein DedA with SNARE-associated domain